MRASWLVERIAPGGVRPPWRTERMSLSAVLEDLLAAKGGGDQLRFIAPWHATDEDLDTLLKRGAIPTFPGPDDSSVDEFLKELISKDLRMVGGG